MAACDTAGRMRARTMAPFRTGLAALMPAAALVGAMVLPAAAAPSLTGPYDLTEPAQHRECRLVLRGEAAAQGHAVAMPAGCHKAFAVLASVVSWSEAGDGGVRLVDAFGQPVLDFTLAQGGLAATGPQGEMLRLAPAGRRLGAAAAVAPVQVAAAQPAAAAAPAAAGPALKPAEIAGRYAVLRDKGRDTGCMVTLDEKARGPGGTFKALLAPACRDQGIVIFDPVGWQVVSGRLVLTARKGHTTHLDHQSDGTWLKDPKEGKSLGLRRL